MKNFMKTLCASIFVLPVLFVFTACGTTTLYSTTFSKGNEGAFITTDYGALTENTEAKTVTVKPVADTSDGNVLKGPTTYFGENTAKNTSWKEGGMTASITLKIKAADYETGHGFNWTIAVNQLQGTNGNQFASERSIYFRKYADGVKVGYEFNGSSDEINATATSNSKAVKVADGTYTIDFYIHKATKENKSIIVTDISVKDKDGKDIFKVENQGLDYSPAAGDPLVSLPADKITGIRYGWFSWMTVPQIEVTALKLTAK